MIAMDVFIVVALGATVIVPSCVETNRIVTGIMVGAKVRTRIDCYRNESRQLQNAGSIAGGTFLSIT